MKLIELFEDISSITAYGWWVSPTGTPYPISSAEGHKRFIVNNFEFFKDDKNLQFNELYDRGFYHGWIRMSSYVSSYSYGRKRTVSVEGKQSSLIKTCNQLFEMIDNFNKVEVNILSENPEKTLDNKLQYQSIDFQVFNIPEEIEELEKYLKGTTPALPEFSRENLIQQWKKKKEANRLKSI